ncbi:MAG TPA: nicotinate-nucleotide adenylyltransferase [Solirubrobacteraceae bacterium]|nr:nicotinate-nucleotide adenylyltransferase [Solirubrobacteraceae bacterium]
MARVGLLGGTFNPPHVGHLVCADCAREELGLDVVRLVVAGSPPHKEVEWDPGADVRAELARLAAAGEPALEVSLVELSRPGPSYTVDTLRALHAEAPGDELTFIVGGDMALSFPRWREPGGILALARLGVALRAADREAVRSSVAAVGAEALERLDLFEMPRIDVSSSLVRERVAAGRSIRYLVPDAVRERIERLGLYRGGARVGEAAWV